MPTKKPDPKLVAKTNPVIDEKKSMQDKLKLENKAIQKTKDNK